MQSCSHAGASKASAPGLFNIQSCVRVMLIHTSTQAGRTQLSNGEANGSDRIMAIIDQSLQRPHATFAAL